METKLQEPKSSTPGRFVVSSRGPHSDAGHGLDLQNTIGNRAVQRRLPSRPEKINNGSTGDVSQPSELDSTRIPLHFPGADIQIRSDPDSVAFLGRNRAVAATLDTSTIAIDPAYRNSRALLLHEYAHVAQLRSGLSASREEAEVAADDYARGARTDVGGAAAPPLFQHAIPAAGGTDPLASEAQARSDAEARDLPMLGTPKANRPSTVEVGSEGTKLDLGRRNLFHVTVSAAGANGQVESATDFTLHQDSEQRYGSRFVGPAVGPPAGTIIDIEGPHGARLAPTEPVPLYPVILKYERYFTMTDRDGRSCGVTVTSTVQFSYQTWKSATAGRGASLATLQDLKGDTAFTGIVVTGGGAYQKYDAMASSEARSIHAGIAEAEANLRASQQFEDAADLPMTFVRPDQTAGAQFSTLEAVLARLDKKEMERRAKLHAINLTGDESDDKPPAWSRGLNSTLEKALLAIGGVLAVAGALAALPGVTFGMAFAWVGATLLAFSVVQSLISRMKEAAREGVHNPLSILSTSVLDAIGAGGFYEAITDRSLLSGRKLNRTEEERWESGSAGLLGLIMTAVGVRSAAKNYRARPTEPEPIKDVAPDVEPAPTILDEDISSPDMTRKNGRLYIEDKRVPNKDFNEPRPDTRRLDAEDIVRRPDETRAVALARVRTVIGRRISDTPFVNTWNRVVARVTHGESPAALGRDRVLALYKRAQGEFWEEVACDPAARQSLRDAGIDFEPGHRAPLVQVNDPAAIPWYERKINLDHTSEKAIGDNWLLALDPDHLEFQPQGPNQYREAIQARHPDLRPVTETE